MVTCFSGVISSTMASVRTSTPVFFSIRMKRPAYSGPVSSS